MIFLLEDCVNFIPVRGWWRANGRSGFPWKSRQRSNSTDLHWLDMSAGSMHQSVSAQCRNMRFSVCLSQELRNCSPEMSKVIHLYNWGSSDTSAQFIMEAMKFISSHVGEYCLIIRTVDWNEMKCWSVYVTKEIMPDAPYIFLKRSYCYQ